MLGSTEPVLSVENSGQRSDDLKVKRTESLEVHSQHKHISEKRSHHSGEKHRGILASFKFLKNPWVRLVVYMLACFSTSCIYYGWQDYKGMMVRGGAYAWKCPPEDGDEVCDDRAQAIDSINLIATAFEYASAATGGVMLDHVGPRMSAVVGEAMWGLGILLFAVSTQKAQLYIPAHILIGSAVNIVCFPSLSVIETFPAWHSLMVGLVLGVQSLTVMPTVLLAIMKKGNFSFKSIWLFYLLLVWLPISALYIIALPGKRNFQGILGEQLKEMEVEEVQLESGENAPSSGLDEVERGETTSTLIEKQLSSASSVEQDPVFETREASWREFFRNITTLDVILFSICYLCLQHVYSFFPVVVEKAISKEMSQFYSYFLPTQAFWLIVVGLMCKWCPTMIVTLGMCVALEFGVVISLFPHIGWLQYCSSVVLIITNCAVYEVKYTFVAEMFDPYNYGKLVGFFGVVGGVGAILGLATILIKPYWRAWTLFLCVMPLVFVISGLLYWRQRRGVTYKTKPEFVQNSDKVDA